jgi:hypothetical protein
MYVVMVERSHVSSDMSETKSRRRGREEGVTSQAHGAFLRVRTWSDEEGDARER